ncbi:MAG: ATP-binding protein [Bacilli bacterium]|nr:ATP-binding protein [Bacilli bacterium]
MLKEFRVSNFKSIQKEQVFTMEACPKTVVSEYPEHVIEVSGERLLKVTSIYGPNGGGKSNLLKALNAFAVIIKQNSLFNDSIKNENYFPNIYLDNKNTVFTLYIVRGGYEIGYSLTLNLNKMQQTVANPFAGQLAWVVDAEILEEEMVYRKLEDLEFLTLFKRNNSGIVESELLSDIDLIKNNRSLSKNYTFLKYFNDSFVQDQTNADATPIFIFYTEIGSYVWVRRELRTFNYLKDAVEMLKPCLNKSKQMLNALDIRIEGLSFEEKDPGFYYLYIQRKNKDGKLVSMPLTNESSGTIKAVNIIFDILTSPKESVCIADDFDAHLHPKLLRAIIELFASKENESRQLIFNSHDIINMNNKLFRRDEIWFAYRDDDYSTQYVPLSNIVNYKGEMIRKDAVYSKQYLEGRFGADPFIKKGLNWCDE